MLSANEFMQFLSGAVIPAAKPASGRSPAVVPVEDTASSLLSGEHSSEDARAKISEMLSRLDTANPDNTGEEGEFARTFLSDLQSLLSSDVSSDDWFAERGSALNATSQQSGGSLLLTGEPGAQAQPWTLDELAQLAQQFLVDGKQLPETAWQDGQNLPQQLAALLAGLEPSGSARSMSAELGMPVQSAPAAATSAPDVSLSAGVSATAHTSAPLPGLKLGLDAVPPRGEQTVSADVTTATADKAARISEAISSQAALASADGAATAAAAQTAEASAALTAEASASLSADKGGAALAAYQAVNLQNLQPQSAAPDLSAVQSGSSTLDGTTVNASLQTVGTGADNQMAAKTSAASQPLGAEPLVADDGLSTPQLNTNTEKSVAAAAATAAIASVDAAIPAAPLAEPRRSTLAEQLSSANRRGADAGMTTLGSATAGPLQTAAGFTVSEPMTPAGGTLSLAIEQVMAESAGTDSNSPARQEASLLKSATPTAQELAAELFGAADQRRANTQSPATLSTAAAMAPAARGADSSLMLQVGSFGQAGWGDNVARQLMVMTANGINSAQIRLDPPELGTLTVRVQMVDQSATVNFVSQHAMVRDALDAQIPRLQDLFRNEGIDLLDVTVSDQQTSAQGDGHGQDGRGSRHAGGELDSELDSADALANIPARSLHLVDEHV
ncbi:MAG: flagellar hook-length control protein FliK [Pseudomonadota bacterium]|nr:flagellar hook-length control protein FliK [Pseudomonadota bacterium]